MIIYPLIIKYNIISSYAVQLNIVDVTVKQVWGSIPRVEVRPSVSVKIFPETEPSSIKQYHTSRWIYGCFSLSLNSADLWLNSSSIRMFCLSSIARYLKSFIACSTGIDFLLIFCFSKSCFLVNKFLLPFSLLIGYQFSTPILKDKTNAQVKFDFSSRNFTALREQFAPQQSCVFYCDVERRMSHIRSSENGVWYQRSS